MGHGRIRESAKIAEHYGDLAIHSGYAIDMTHRICHGTNLCAYVTTVVCAVRGLRPVAYYTLSCPLFSFVVNQVF